MKKLLSIGLVLILALCYSCKEDEDAIIEVGKVEVTPVTLSLVEEITQELTVKVLPEDATDRSIVWSSSDETIATVTSAGEVKAIAEGVVDIIASSKNEKKGICKLTVVKKVIDVTNINFDSNNVDIIEGETQQVNITVLPENATDKTVTWTSADETIATISADGLITAKAFVEGVNSVIITATSVNNISNSFLLKVVKKAPAKKYSIKCCSQEVRRESSMKLILLDKEGLDYTGDITWTSKNPEIVEVDEHGSLSSKSILESATIVATFSEGVCEYTIKVVKKTMLDVLYQHKYITEGKPVGSWFVQKIKFEGSDIDMDFNFKYESKKAEATATFSYVDNGTLIHHKSLLLFKENSFELLTPLSINDNEISSFYYTLNGSTFATTDSGFKARLINKLNGIPVYSNSDCIFKHRLDIGSKETSNSAKMWELQKNVKTVLKLEDDNISSYQFRIYTYDKAVAYEGNQKMFSITYYDRVNYKLVCKDFKIENFTKTDNGSVVFNKFSEVADWYQIDDEGSKNLVEDPKTSKLFDIMFSNKGWSIVEERAGEQFVFISNEDPTYSFKAWTYFDDSDW